MNLLEQLDKISNMTNENKIRKSIRKHLFECINEMMVDEERIPNDEGREKVSKKENFIGSHCWGELLPSGDYIVASYGEQFPLFIYDSKEKIWYENEEQYIFNGESVESTEEHRTLLKPSVDTHSKSLKWMLKKLDSLKNRNGLGELSHLSVEPGTKN